MDDRKQDASIYHLGRALQSCLKVLLLISECSEHNRCIEYCSGQKIATKARRRYCILMRCPQYTTPVLWQIAEAAHVVKSLTWMQDGSTNIRKQCQAMQRAVPAALQGRIATHMHEMQRAASSLSHTIWQRQGYQGRLAAMGCLSQGPAQNSRLSIHHRCMIACGQFMSLYPSWQVSAARTSDLPSVSVQQVDQVWIVPPRPNFSRFCTLIIVSVLRWLKGLG